jgi:two-component system, NarL family, invasion response regulator UvrY
MLSVLIADDHEVVRRGLREILQEHFPDVHIAEACDSDQVLARLESQPWDVLLLDVVMPRMNVIELIERVARWYPATRILVLTAIEEMEYAVRCLRSGASGFLTKHQASSDLVHALEQVRSGGTYITAEVQSALAAPGGRSSAAHESLSQRELAVLCHIARGKALKEIAFELSVSSKTVATYVQRIKDKTGLQSYVDMTRYAMQHQLVE